VSIVLAQQLTSAVEEVDEARDHLLELLSWREVQWALVIPYNSTGVIRICLFPPSKVDELMHQDGFNRQHGSVRRQDVREDRTKHLCPYDVALDVLLEITENG
jgi:hypothetical protein